MASVFLYAWTQIKRFTRDPMALFFTILFPLIFLFVFGSIFGNDNGVSFDVAIYNNSDSEFSKSFVEQSKKDDTFAVVDAGTIDEAREKMSRGELDSIIEIPESFGRPNEQGLPSGDISVYYDESDASTGQTVASIMNAIFTEINTEISGQAPLFTVNQKAAQTAGLSSFDYVFSGLLGFTMLSMGVFGLANQLPAEKKNGTLRRIRATPFTRSKLIFGTMLYYGFIGLVSLTTVLIAGLVFFNFDMRGDWIQLILFATLGIVLMLGFGLLIGGAAKNENQAAVLGNLVSFPMMFLSGVFFPSYLMPEWVQSVSTFIPLTPIIEGIRYITTEGATLLDLGPQLAIIGVWLVVVYVAAIRLFRWE